MALAASLRRDSFNRKLLHLAVPLARAAGAEVEVVDFRDVLFPAYNADEQQEHGIPPEVTAFGQRIAGSDGFLLASPEYNHSIPGALKNTIDWVSRIRPMPWQGRWALLLSASNSRVGGNRGLWQLRQPFASMGTFVYPEMFSLAEAPKALDSAGQLAEPALATRLETLVRAFVATVVKHQA
jgi:NAD(P)H-dependent FMN reductase